MYFILVLISILTALGFYYYISNKITVFIGSPNINSYLIGYKYSFRNHSSVEFKHRQIKNKFLNAKSIKLCYCNEMGTSVEYAFGVVLSEEPLKPPPDLFPKVLKFGLSLHTIPSLSNAIYAYVPLISWLPLFGHLALSICYSKIFDIVEENRMCAYPILEIYDDKSVTVIAPLSRQDDYVVAEAHRLVHNLKFSALLSPFSNNFDKLPAIDEIKTNLPSKSRKKKKL